MVKSSSSIWYSKNKKRAKLAQKEWHSKNSDHVRNNALLRNFGITLDEYNSILLKQNSVCALCERPEVAIDNRTGKIKNLSVDHDHKTGKVRGLLCHEYNTGIGKLQEDPLLLLKASKYVVKGGL
jgi:hypothetical protein